MLGPTIWVDILGNTAPLFPYRYPALFSMPAALLVTWAVSSLDRSRAAESERARFDRLVLQLDAAGIRRVEPVKVM